RTSRSEDALRAHIVAFHGAFTNPAAGCVCAVLEYMDGLSVHDAMEARQWAPFEDDALSVIAHGAAAGLAALHNDRQLHRDIKPSNLLLDWRWRVKLSDFGVSRAVDNTLGVAQTYVGTLAFMAPERIVGGEYSFASDVWSIGLCLATLALGRIPLPQ
ncbi:kinase-like domain-containing protein, partial [Pelagophyceae sp. CCMP2097]